MIEIFDKMMSKEFDESVLLSKAYALIHNLNEAWIVCDDCTIKEQCHRICDELEASGVNLDNVPLSVIKEKFAEIKFSVEYPPEYLQLQKSLQYVEEQKARLLKFSHANESSKEIIDSHILAIKTKIQEYHD